jgi:hypothetical protein
MGNVVGRMTANRRSVVAGEIAKGKEHLRRALELYGVLLIHDNVLPSATSAITGESIRGSWWGHDKGNLIYAILEDLGGDVDCCKLVKGKDTLIVKRFWPALSAIGVSRQAWQLTGLGPAGKWMLEQVVAHGERGQSELAKAKAIPGIGAVMTDLQKRILVYGHSEHTAAGLHQKTLKSWPAWQKDRHIAAHDVPPVDAAIAIFQDAVRSWGTDAESLFPWGKSAAGAPSRARSPARRR